MYGSTVQYRKWSPAANDPETANDPQNELQMILDRKWSQDIVDKVAEWSMQNRVKLNSGKCKELRISFVKNEPRFAPIVVDGKELERVTSAKLLGLTISSNLTWNEHISDVIKKASKRLYFLVQLKRSRVPRHDMSTFYTACIRPVLTYAAPAFFYAQDCPTRRQSN